MQQTCSAGCTGSIYHVNVIYSLGGGHTHTYRLCRQKQFQETRRMLAFGWCAPGLKISIIQFVISCNYFYAILHNSTGIQDTYFSGCMYSSLAC